MLLKVVAKRAADKDKPTPDVLQKNLEQIVITSSLESRPTRTPDYKLESETLLRLAKEFVDAPTSIYRALSEQVLKVCRAESSGISIATTNGPEKVFKFVAASGRASTILGATVPYEFSPCGHVAHEAKPELMKQPARFYGYINDFGMPVEEVLVVPLLKDNEVIGTIWGLNHSEDRQFDSEDLRQLRSLAAFCAAFLKVSESTSGHRDAEIKLNLAIEGAKLGTWHLDLSTNRTTISETAAAIHGMNLEDSLDDVIAQSVHPDDRASLKERLEKSIRDGSVYANEFRIVRPDGEVRWIFSRGQRELDENGQPASFSGIIGDITEDKLAAEKLQLEKHKIETLISQSPAAIALWRGANFVYEIANPNYLELTGRKDLVGKTLYEAFPELADQEFPNTIKKVFETGVPYVGNEKLVRLSPQIGAPVEERYMNLNYSRVNDPDGRPYGVFSHAMDVTDRVRARLQLEKSERELRLSQEQITTAVRVSKIGFYDWDMVRDVVTYSEEMQKDWGIGPQTPFEAALLRIHSDDRSATLKSIDRAVREKTRFQAQYRVVRPDGAIVWIEVQGAASYDNLDRPIRFFGTSLNIEERKRVELELEAAKDAAEIAKNEAERANQLKSAFLANMSHEIRTPLGAMLGFADLLREPTLSPEERANYIDILSRNGESLSVIINDILDLSKVEAGHLTLDYNDTQPDVIGADVVSLMKVKAKEKGLVLTYEFDESTPKTLVTDANRVRQILLNIVGNAIKFTQYGHVKLRSYGVEGESGWPDLCFEISDTGIGIAANQQEKIFEMFVQADGNLTRRFGGTGLGLALSRRLARELGGDVTIKESKESVGTTFVVRVADRPNRREAEEKPTSQDFVAEVKERALEGMRVLVVDDAPDNQMLIWSYLTKQGAIVESAENGLLGYKAALTGQFDLVLMDIQMPHMDGYTATQKLREAGFTKPIIALTAHAMSEVRKKALNVGYTDHLPKPINAKNLIQAIVRHSSSPEQ